MIGSREGQILAGRLPGIDVLRALAASAVVLTHVIRWPWGFAYWGIFGALSRFGDQLGNWGVGVFFVLSGTCIHLPVARRLAAGAPPDLDLGSYLKRRVRRIYPPHALVIGLSWLVAARTTLPPGFEPYLSIPTATQFWAHVFLLHTFVPGAIYSINCVLWTIAIESHFYLIYPLLLRLRRRLSMGTLCAGLFFLMLALRALDTILPTAIRGVLTYNFPGLLWQWVFGAVIAERLARRPPAPLNQTLVVGCAAFSALAVCAVGHLPHGLLLLAVVGPPAYGVVVLVASSMRISSGMSVTRILEWIGLRSYSLYLTHPIAITLAAVVLMPWLHRPAALVALAFASAYLLAALYFVMVESRFVSRARTDTSANGAIHIGPVGAAAVVIGSSKVEPGS
jgi:exopolysaccharide production protein ExoZ